MSDTYKKVPMIFRAQVDGRCQLQRLVRDQEPDVVRWTDEWTERTYPEAPSFAENVQTQTYTINWRFVSNGGQDDSIIRPVIGARGWPFFPGSSMKGAFRRACSPEERDRYCGRELTGGDYQPGILRFHGGYPTDINWTEGLVDIVHPQQDWQVKTDSKSAGAFAQISLYQPQFRFGISSSIPITAAEWQKIWEIWERAFSKGIGCRVSAGYGQPAEQAADILYRCRLQGQGQAPKLFDSSGEFRPNIFRAAVRGHALRIFGGLTNAKTAEQLVEALFGGVQGKGTVGLLSTTFRTSELAMETFGQGSYAQTTYDVEGELIWSLAKPLQSTEHREALVKLIEALTRFAVVLGGFGKSWRRADHRLFLPDYYDQGYKPLIGCHWQWAGKRSLLRDVQVRKLEQVGDFIGKVRQTAQEWMQLHNIQVLNAQNAIAPWREAWHPERVEIWGRLANEAEDCEAIRWLHGPYRPAIPSARIPEGSIYSSSITGKVGQIGKLWHRMYPYVRLVKDPSNPTKPKALPTSQYFELLTLFPDDSLESAELLTFLKTQQKLFQQIWGSYEL